MTKRKSPQTKQISPRITMQAHGLLESIYKSANHGAQEACRCWPIVRMAVIKTFKRSPKWTKRERKQLYSLDLPHDCDKYELLKAIAKTEFCLAGRIKAMSAVEAMVLIDMIRNDDLNQAARFLDSNGVEI